MRNRIVLPALLFLSAGCAALFGWDIHAPGLLSAGYFQDVQPVEKRVALYPDPALLAYISKNKGGWSADPQTYHVGEALAPMLVEGFQQGFQEFVFFETEPTPELLKRFGIDALAVVRVKSFGNKVTWKGQGVSLVTETVVMGPDMKPLAKFEASGASDAEKVFAKKGGPEVNLNAALENNVKAIVQYLQDGFSSGAWKAGP